MKINRILLILSVILISILGLVMITSSSYIWAEYKFNDPYKFLKTQGLFLIIGYLLLYFVSKIHYSFYYKNSSKIFLIVLILIILVIIPGIGTIRNGSRSWFGIGSFGIQPSEFMKLAIIIFISKYLVKNEKNINNFKKTVLPILLVVGLVFGLVMLQPDFGTGVIIVMISISILFIAGVNLKFFLKLGVLGIIGVIGLILMAPYRIKRILSFLNPWSDPLGSGFQIIQSLYAIGPGGLFGLGLGNSIQKHFYLPEPQTDFIFAIISEELGIIGCIIVVVLFLSIIINGFYIAKKQDDLFSKYLAFGITFWIAFQSLLNLMVVVGIIPVTGVTLPFLSYGGSSLLINMISIGILISIEKNN